MHLSYSAVALPLLEDRNNEYLSVDERSWFASIGTIATILGCLISGYMLDKLGRKWTMISVNVPFIIGWSIIWAAPRPASAILLYVGRILTGLGGGMVSVPASIYIGEMSTKSMRPMLVAWPTIAIKAGILLVYIYGWIIQDNWRLVAAICLICPITNFILIYVTLKESPTWLAIRGRNIEAKETLKWIRNLKTEDNLPENVEIEYQTILQNAKRKRNNNAKGSKSEDEEENNCCGGFKESIRNLCRPDAWKPLLLVNTYFFFLQFAGINVLTTYTVNIMIATRIEMDPYFCAFLLGLVQLISGTLATFILTRVGRRPMSMISGVGMSICMLALGVYLQLLEEKYWNGLQINLSWIPLLLLISFTICASIGFRLVPWALVGEVYPTHVRGVAGGITTCFSFLCGFIVIKYYPDYIALLGGGSAEINATAGVFYLYGAVAVLGTIFVYFFLPETLNKSLEEISQSFLSTNHASESTNGKPPTECKE